MPRVDTAELRQVLESNPEPYLLEHSGLPGPRANLELARAVAETARPELLWRLAEWGPKRAPANSPEEFLGFCGIVGLGRLAVQGEDRALTKLRGSASDPRWRIREAVAMALQVFGRSHPDRLSLLLEVWADGNAYEQRAVVAAVCEPDLLAHPPLVEQALTLLERFTRQVAAGADRQGDAFRVLRQTLGYAWSVVVAADPERARARFETWVDHADPDVRWIVRENLHKKRLIKMDGEWVERMLARMESPPGG